MYIEDVPGMALQLPADRLQGAEVDPLDLARLQKRQVGDGDPDPLGQFGQGNLALDQHQIESDFNGHADNAGWDFTFVNKDLCFT
jgi:hypothetical protein